MIALSSEKRGLRTGQPLLSSRDGQRFHSCRLISPSSKDPYPVAWPVAKSIVSNWIIVNVPVAPANRPVPFSIVATFVSLEVFGGMKTPRPTNVPDNWSPFAAVKLKVPVPVLSGLTVAVNVPVNRPRWVAVPSAVAWAEGGGTSVTVVNEPLNGSAVPPRAAVWAGPKLAFVGDVGEFKSWPLQAAANRHTPRTISRMGNSLSLKKRRG